MAVNRRDVNQQSHWQAAESRSRSRFWWQAKIHFPPGTGLPHGPGLARKAASVNFRLEELMVESTGVSLVITGAAAIVLIRTTPRVGAGRMGDDISA